MNPNDPTNEIIQEQHWTNLMKEKPFWLSIRRAKNCPFGRRLGFSGKIVLGYSIRLRLFGKNII